jgi:hypothetical protein
LNPSYSALKVKEATSQVNPMIIPVLKIARCIKLYMKSTSFSLLAKV